MKKTLILLSLLPSIALATGPSLVDAQVKPLSINDKGELLYKYLIIENPTGANASHPMMTGFGIFKDGEHTAINQEILNIDPMVENSEINYWEKRGQNEAWFKQPCSEDELVDGFSSCNAESNKKQQWMTITEFNTNYGVDLLKTNPRALSYSDIYASSQDHIYVDYDFPEFVLLQFTVESCFDDGLASLVVPNTIMNDSANERNTVDPIPFDCAVASTFILK